MARRALRRTGLGHTFLVPAMSLRRENRRELDAVRDLGGHLVSRKSFKLQDKPALKRLASAFDSVPDHHSLRCRMPDNAGRIRCPTQKTTDLAGA
jgi:hypothetical protein